MPARRPGTRSPGRLFLCHPQLGAAGNRLGVNCVHGGFAPRPIRASIQVADFPEGISASGRHTGMLRILIVEDDSQLAATLK
jgi:hypothetical protein